MRKGEQENAYNREGIHLSCGAKRLYFVSGGLPAEAAYTTTVNGRLGVGTTSPNYPLDVVTNEALGFAGAFFNDGNNLNRWGIGVAGGADDGNGENNLIHLFTGNGTCKGYLQIDDQTVEIAQYSDVRLKENIIPAPIDGLEMVLSLPVREFNFIGSSVRQYGFIAQELEAVYPDAVGMSPHSQTQDTGAGTTVVDGIRTIKPLKLIPILVHAVQKQEEKIEALEVRIEALEQRNAALLSHQMSAAPLGGGASARAILTGGLGRVLPQAGVDLWKEIPLAQAVEEVDEVREEKGARTVTKYRFNVKTMSVEPYTVQETVVETVPTGRTTRRIKPDVFFDESSGKFLRRVDPVSAPKDGEI